MELLLRRRPRKADRGGSADALVLTEIVEGCPTATVKLGRSFQFDFACDVGESEDIWLDLRDDGIVRYYAARPGQTAPPRPGKNGKIVRFGSRRHKMLFCAAQRIIAPAADFATYSPMPEKSLLDFADLFNGGVETAPASLL